MVNFDDLISRLLTNISEDAVVSHNPDRSDWQGVVGNIPTVQALVCCLIIDKII
jgi:hypothetical protein